jgi:hypothetical protein
MEHRSVTTKFQSNFVVEGMKLDLCGEPGTLVRVCANK